ncbi:23S rRNA methyltransferase attenuation leader peptide [Streptococcus suis]
MLVFQMRYQMRYVDKTSTVLKQTKNSDYVDK